MSSNIPDEDDDDDGGVDDNTNNNFDDNEVRKSYVSLKCVSSSKDCL